MKNYQKNENLKIRKSFLAAIKNFNFKQGLEINFINSKTYIINEI